jgi:hypothetical protein
VTIAITIMGISPIAIAVPIAAPIMMIIAITGVMPVISAIAIIVSAAIIAIMLAAVALVIAAMTVAVAGIGQRGRSTHHHRAQREGGQRVSYGLSHYSFLPQPFDTATEQPTLRDVA